MNLIKQTLHNLFSQCLPSLFSNKINNIKTSFEMGPISNKTYNINFMDSNSSIINNSIKDHSITFGLSKGGNLQEDILLVNNPDLYNKLFNNFINNPGINSNEVKSLISPEKDLADRAFNLHCIMGSSTNDPILLNNLKRKDSLSNLLNNPQLQSPGVNDSSTDSFEKLLNQLESTSRDIGMLNNSNYSADIDRILTDHSEAIKIALDIIS